MKPKCKSAAKKYQPSGLRVPWNFNLESWDLYIYIAWFVAIFGINTTSDISKLLYVISWAVRALGEWNLKKFSGVVFMPNITYKSCYYLFVLSTNKRFVIFTRRYFKLSWNTTALSQSNRRNFSCSSISILVIAWFVVIFGKNKTTSDISKLS